MAFPSISGTEEKDSRKTRNRLRRSKPPPAMLNSHGRNLLSASSSATFFYDEPDFAGRQTSSRRNSSDLKRNSGSSATLDDHMSAPDLLLKAFSDFLGGKKKRHSSEFELGGSSQKSLVEAFPPISPVELEHAERGRYSSQRSSTTSFDFGVHNNLGHTSSDIKNTEDRSKRRSFFGSRRSSVDERPVNNETLQSRTEERPNTSRRRSLSLVRAARRLSGKPSEEQNTAATASKINNRPSSSKSKDTKAAHLDGGKEQASEDRSISRKTSLFRSRSRKRRKSPPPVSYYNRMPQDYEGRQSAELRSNESDSSLPLQHPRTSGTDQDIAVGLVDGQEGEEEPVFHAITTEENEKVDLGSLSTLPTSPGFQRGEDSSFNSSETSSPKRVSSEASSNEPGKAPVPSVASTPREEARESESFLGGWRLKAAMAANQEKRNSPGAPVVPKSSDTEGDTQKRQSTAMPLPITPLEIRKSNFIKLVEKKAEAAPIITKTSAPVENEERTLLQATPSTSSDTRRRLVKRDRRASKIVPDTVQLKAPVPVEPPPPPSSDVSKTASIEDLNKQNIPQIVVAPETALEALKREADKMIDAPLEPPPKSPSRPRSMNLSSMESLASSDIDGNMTPVAPYAAQFNSVGSSTESLGNGSSSSDLPAKISPKVAQSTSSLSLNSERSTASIPIAPVSAPPIPAPRLPVRRERGKESPLRHEVTDSPPPQEKPKEEKPLMRRPSEFPVPSPHSSAQAIASSSRDTGGSSSGSLRPVAKVFVICCRCKYWHDLPSAWYSDMLKNGSVTKCPYCIHPMSTKCCSGYTCVVYLHQRHH